MEHRSSGGADRRGEWSSPIVTKPTWGDLDYCLSRMQGKQMLPLGGYASRWKLEFLVKVGYYESHYDPYDAGYPFNGRYYYRWFDSPSKFLRRNHRFRYFGPSGAGVTLSYDLFRKKI